MKVALSACSAILCAILGCCVPSYTQKLVRYGQVVYKKPVSVSPVWKKMSRLQTREYPFRLNRTGKGNPASIVSNQTVNKLLLVSAVERARFAAFAKPVLNSSKGILRYFPGKKEIDAVIFDLDGTLFNSLSVWEHSGSNFVRSQGFEPPAELDDQLVKMSLMDGARLIKETYHLPYTLEEIVEMTLHPIRSHYYQDIQPMPGIPELLAKLKSQGVKMVIATASYKEFAEVALLRLGLADYFDFIITCDEVGIGKSSPKVYEVAAQRLGTPKDRTLVAEDALHALQTAHQAGFKTAAVEEAHSAHQQLEKQAVADYYVFSFQGINTLQK